MTAEQKKLKLDFRVSIFESVMIKESDHSWTKVQTVALFARGLRAIRYLF